MVAPFVKDFRCCDRYLYRGTRPQVGLMNHIENERLLNFTEGKIELAQWERQHLHECEFCQEIVCGLLRQLDASRS